MDLPLGHSSPLRVGTRPLRFHTMDLTFLAQTSYRSPTSQTPLPSPPLRHPPPSDPGSIPLVTSGVVGVDVVNNKGVYSWSAGGVVYHVILTIGSSSMTMRVRSFVKICRRPSQSLVVLPRVLPVLLPSEVWTGVSRIRDFCTGAVVESVPVRGRRLDPSPLE